MAVVTFDYAAWAAQFPELADKVAEPLATVYFTRRCPLYLDNTDGSLVTDPDIRAGLLDLLVAHIAAVSGASAAAAQGLVGRISSVTEGSVTIATEYPVKGDMAAWFAQTPYGAQFWAATARYRTFLYVPGDEPYLDVPGFGARWPR